MTTSNRNVVSAYVANIDNKETLRIEAAKRGMTLSRYCGLLLDKATNGYTDFDVAGHEETFKPKQYVPRKKKE